MSLADAFSGNSDGHLPRIPVQHQRPKLSCFLLCCKQTNREDERRKETKDSLGRRRKSLFSMNHSSLLNLSHSLKAVKVFLRVWLTFTCVCDLFMSRLLQKTQRFLSKQLLTIQSMALNRMLESGEIFRFVISFFIQVRHNANPKRGDGHSHCKWWRTCAHSLVLGKNYVVMLKY